MRAASGWLLKIALAIVVLAVFYTWLVISWSYSSGERAGYVQKLSRKGWICKTWEGEIAMVAMPGTTSEKFLFTVRDDAIAEQINGAMGKRVSLEYEEHVGVPTSCFGDTPYFVTGVRVVDDPKLIAPVVVPSAPPPVEPAAKPE
jgi:hypothetical protein